MSSSPPAASAPSTSLPALSVATPPTSAGDAGSAPRVSVLLSSTPDAAVADRIARALVEEGLAACVTQLPGARSVYRWQGALEEASEVILLAKISAATTVLATQRIRELHPYECPEILTLPAMSGFEPYLRWVEESCTVADASPQRAPDAPATPSDG